MEIQTYVLKCPESFDDAYTKHFNKFLQWNGFLSTQDYEGRSLFRSQGYVLIVDGKPLLMRELIS